MKMPEIEMVQQEDMPTPRQLGRLAAEMLCFSRRHQQLRVESLRGGYAKKFKALPSTHYERPDVTSGAPFGLLYRTTLGAIATNYCGYEWNMRLFRSFEAESMVAASPGGTREVFSFQWNDTETSLARRRLYSTPVHQAAGIDDMVENFSFRDDDLVLAELGEVMELPTRGDVELLIQDIRDAHARVDRGDVQYTERRKNYFDYTAY